MPQYTVVMCYGDYDNSANNPANPDPTQEVAWGDQSTDEMMLGVLAVSLPPGRAVGEFPKVTPLGDDRFEVEFRYRPDARHAHPKTVSLVGDFNRWNKTQYPLEGPDEAGAFHIKVPMPAGHHEYKFIVNDTDWTPDPDNPLQNGPFNSSVVRLRTK